jgi:arylsulfatase A-like enzyme
VRLILLARLVFCCVPLAADDRPNIVYFMVDDLGYADCGFNGGTEIATPNLDALAASGVVLESFYVQPVCSPTRGALMTGRYPIRLGLQVGVIRPWAEYGLPLEERTLAEAIRGAGYRTGICGKWHLGSFDRAYYPGARGFDHAYGQLFGAVDYFTHIRDEQLDWYRNGELIEEEGYTTHLLASEAENFINTHDKKLPFFLYVPFNAVHTPLQAPEEYLAPYSALPERRRTMAGMLAALDEAVGRIVAAIDDAGERDNTLFIFSSDNGGYQPGAVTDNTPLREGKGTLYEGGVRVCAFASWPGHLPSGERNREMLHIVDWYPTLVRLAGGSLEQELPLDGLDIWETLAHGAPSPHAEVLLNASPTEGAIRAGDWKLVIHHAIEATEPRIDRRGNVRPGREGREETMELYNLANDLSEANDVAAEHPDRVADLRARYDLYAGEAVTPMVSPPRPPATEIEP